MNVAILGRDKLVLQLVDRTLDYFDRLTTFLEKFDHADKCCAHVVVALAEQGLLNEAIKTLNVLLVDNFGQDAKSVGLHHIVIALLDVFAQARDNNEDLILIHLKLFDENVDQASQVLVLAGRHLEKLRYVEEHGAFLELWEVLTLQNSVQVERAKLGCLSFMIERLT